MRRRGNGTRGGLLLVLLACAPAPGAAQAQTPPPTAGIDPGEQTRSVRPATADELRDELCSGRPGTIVVPRDVRWKVTGPCPRAEDRLDDSYSRAVPNQDRAIPIRSNVQLIGERGFLHSRPTLYTDDLSIKHSVFAVVGNDVVIRGVHFDGPQPGANHRKRPPYVSAIAVVENAEARTGRRILIADNEFDEWSNAGVNPIGFHGNVPRKDFEPGWAYLRPSDAGLVRIEGNYMHHNARDGGGYGVSVSGGAYAHIEGNVFDYNRHAVAGSGRAHSGYVARFNYVLQGGYMQHANNAPDYYNQHFDVHGEEPSGYGGYAGVRFEIDHNTFRGEQTYYYRTKSRPAFMLRGRPIEGAFFRGNVAVHDDVDEAVSLKGGRFFLSESERQFNFHDAGNRFDVDYSTELAPGDFDGDGRADVFVANGTAWFFSRAGVRPWEYLRPSDKRTGDLGFADVDNDRVTDVLWRDGAGRVGYVKSGRGPLLPLTVAPVPMRDLRFGDFDGDGRTDVFYTRGGRWYVWYGATRQWRATAASDKPVGQLLFGEFDDVRGTDVVGINRDGWAYSSGATSAWIRLNRRLTDSFANAVAADFGGDGRSDIAISNGQKWRWSLDGRSPLRMLRDGRATPSYRPLKQLLIGRFEPHDRDLVIAFEGERLVMWRGIGTPATFGPRSHQNMR